MLWRLIASLFLHADLLHLLVNGGAVWVLFRLDGALFGSVRTLWLFLLCGMCGALLSWAAGTPSTVGASGGLFGLMGAAISYGWKYRAQLPDQLGGLLRRRLAFWGGLNLGMGVLFPMIDNHSHFGGFISGLIFGLLVDDRLMTPEIRARFSTYIMVVVSGSLCGYALLRMGGAGP